MNYNNFSFEELSEISTLVGLEPKQMRIFEEGVYRECHKHISNDPTLRDKVLLSRRCDLECLKKVKTSRVEAGSISALQLKIVFALELKLDELPLYINHESRSISTIVKYRLEKGK